VVDIVIRGDCVDIKDESRQVVVLIKGTRRTIEQAKGTAGVDWGLIRMIEG
jgi:hypothetical protein